MLQTKMIKYAKIDENDIVNGEGVCVSFWTQGCHFHCKGCHNPQTWDFNTGLEDSEENIITKIKTSITKNDIQRNLSILGGEPLCPENIDFVIKLIKEIKEEYHKIKVFLWTGYEFKDIPNKKILELVDVLVTGPFILEERDLTLKFRGSRNQEIKVKGIDY